MTFPDLIPDLAARLPEPLRSLAASRTHVITPEGRLHAGFEALRTVLLRLPISFLPSLLFWLPGVAPLARAVQRATGARARRERAPVDGLEGEPVWQRSLERLGTGTSSVQEASR